MRRQAEANTILLATPGPQMLGTTARPLCEIRRRGAQHVFDVEQDAEGRTVTLAVRATVLRLFRRGQARATSLPSQDAGGNRPA